MFFSLGIRRYMVAQKITPICEFDEGEQSIGRLFSLRLQMFFVATLVSAPRPPFRRFLKWRPMDSDRAPSVNEPDNSPAHRIGSRGRSVNILRSSEQFYSFRWMSKKKLNFRGRTLLRAQTVSEGGL